MNRRSTLFALGCALVLAPGSASARGGQGVIVLNGKRTGVRWSDGDSFKVIAGPLTGKRARLSGYNALETWGPVHRWGDWTPEELLAIAKATAPIAASKEWDCTSSGKTDGYDRLLVSCPDLSLELVQTGYAMVFAIDEAPAPALVASQLKAQKDKVGMWAKGAPSKLISSAHSKREGKGKAYNRIVDTRTGRAEAKPHGNDYETCSEVCIGVGAERSCVLYVPFDERYHDPPACLAHKSSRRKK